MNLVLFDLDDTLLSGDTEGEWVEFMLNSGMIQDDSFLEQMSIILGTRGRKHPPGHRPGEGGYAKITKIAGSRGSPSRGTRRRFSLENCFKPSQMLKFFSLRGPH